jgi:hypothetical protein
MSAIERYETNKRLYAKLRKDLKKADFRTVAGIFMVVFIPTYKTK